MKPIPTAMATSLNCILSIAILLEYFDEDDKSSEVMSNMMAIAANQRLMSDIVRGKFIIYPSIKR